MPDFASQNLQNWYAKGCLKPLKCRLGTFDVFCIDDNPNNHKETVVLIHGFPTSSYDFAGIWPTVSEKYRMVCLDMLGFGFSDKPNSRKYTIHQQADLFESLIQDLKLEKYHILSHDYGVSVAQELLARQLEGKLAGEALSCTFLNGGLFPETHRALLIQKLMLSPLGKFINKLTGFKQFSKAFSSVFGAETQPSEEELKDFWEAICFNDGKHLFHNLITYILDRREHRERWLTALQKSQSPLAVLNGSVDPVSGAHLVARYQELECRLDYLQELPTIGHYPQVEAPDRIAFAFLEFLRKVAEL